MGRGVRGLRKSVGIQTATINTILFLSVIMAYKTGPRFPTSTCILVSQIEDAQGFTVVMADASLDR